MSTFRFDFVAQLITEIIECQYPRKVQCGVQAWRARPTRAQKTPELWSNFGNPTSRSTASRCRFPPNSLLNWIWCYLRIFLWIWFPESHNLCTNVGFHFVKRRMKCANCPQWMRLSKSCTPAACSLSLQEFKKHHILNEMAGLRISRSKKVTFDIKVTIEISCLMDFSDYPFDEHTCNFQVTHFVSFFVFGKCVCLL